MHRYPTSAYRAWAAGLVVGLGLMGCAGGEDGDAADDPLPTDQAPTQPTESVDKPTHPKFDPAISDPPKQNQDAVVKASDQCIDDPDPGGAQNVATSLPDTDDCDNEYKTVTGVMNGPVDVDFYKLSAKDEGVSFSHPMGCLLDTDFEADTQGTELCVFMRCKNSTVDAVTGCDQGTESTSDIGMKGCCANAPGHALPRWDCSGIGDDDSADIFFRVRQTKGDRCLPYTFKYRF